MLGSVAAPKLWSWAKSTGRPQKLKPVQQCRLLKLLLKGSLAGYNTTAWTTARIVEAIRDPAGRPMHSLN